ncbi:MAG: S-methyl-5-thioribose-1-phosphate isomerase [Candidatus Obscuribacterales bacterium]|nr:S-methyl-5-thioribose-1-phosphate isomerase [Candidatus Obscuribacterales bacterium]
MSANSGKQQIGTGSVLRPVSLVNDRIILLDQRKIPDSLEEFDASSLEDMFFAIQDMVVRGAPAIGVAAALGLAFEARRIAADSKVDFQSFLQKLSVAKERLQSSRPTAVNLRWATENIFELAENNSDKSSAVVADLLLASAEAMIEKDILVNKAIGEYGANLLTGKSSVLTHCNAGALATCGWGTALGVIRSAFERGMNLTVYAGETRPRQQGARLTVWELLHDGIVPTLITDNMAGYLMSQGKVDAVIVGADRIALNGDAANKIGTYSLAVLAQAHGIPFYIAAPISTIDPQIVNGAQIPIEERDGDEVLVISGQSISTDGVKVLNPAFDVTPARLISGIITERGVLYSPYEESIRNVL